MNNKGQALIEFIIIIPIFVMLLLAAFDYARINSTKIELERKVEEIILTTGEEYNDNGTVLDISVTDNKRTYTLSKKIDIYSPILVPIINNDYEIKVKRVVYE